MTTTLGFPPAPLGGKPPATLAEAADTGWVRRIATIVNGILQGKTNSPVIDYEAPATGATLTAWAGLGGFTVDPAAGIAALTIVLPTPASDRDTFEINTTQAITALTVNAGGTETVAGAPATLAANTGICFRYRAADTTWRRRW